MNLLVFSSPACTPCKRLKEVLNELKTSNQISFTEVDIDVDSDQVIKYGIKSVPTMIFLDSQGKEIKRYIGFKTPKFLKEKILMLTEEEKTVDVKF